MEMLANTDYSRVGLMWTALSFLYLTPVHALTPWSENDYVVVEGDICIPRVDHDKPSKRETDAEAELLQDHFLPVTYQQTQRSRRSRRAVTALPDRLWHNATIPYVIGKNVTENVKRNIVRAMAHWERHTCIQFVNRTTQDDYIEFNPGKCGCCSFVGRRGDGKQMVTLSQHCAVYGVVVHELGHVVGFWHEHSRPDRDKYIRILRDNVMSDKLENFDKKSNFEIDSLGQPYDYYSIMHYRRKTFSKNGGNTIEPKLRGSTIGQRDSLSPGDIMQARLLYSCPSEEVTLEFYDFSVEKSVNCSFDYVELREGIDETGSLIGRLCGEGMPGIIQSSSSLWLRFTSDSSITLRGFMAHFYKSSTGELSGSGSGATEDLFSSGHSWVQPSAVYRARCNTYLSGRKGTIRTPIVPVFFSSKPVECSWTIDGGKNGTRIQLELNLLLMNVEEDQCMGDIYQKVPQEVRHHKHRKHVKYAGPKHQQQVHYDIDRYAPVRYNCKRSSQLLLDSATVMLQWSSDIHQEFTVTYVIDYNECQMDTVKCDHVCHNTLEGYRCTCRTGFQLAENGYQCVPKIVQFTDKCDSVLVSERGKIRASTEPMNDCYFHVSLPDTDYRIYITFSRFKIPALVSKSGKSNALVSKEGLNITTEGFTYVSNDTCGDTYLEVLIGRGKHAKGRFCGRSAPDPLTTPSGILTLRVHTNINKTHTLPYFSAKYIAYKEKDGQEKCFYRIKAEGNITSPGFPDHYPDGSLCMWRISARRGHRVHMKFDVMDIESTKLCNFDYLEVRDGKHRSASFIGRYCDSVIPKGIISTGRHLWLMFISDSTGSGKGFRAYLESQPDKDRTRHNGRHTKKHKGEDKMVEG